MSFLYRLKSWRNYLNTHRKFKLGSVFIILLAVFALSMLYGHFAHAAGTEGTINDKSWWLELLAEILLWVARLFLKLALFVLSFIIQIAGYNNFLDATAVTVGWVMVRDLTNMSFVIILLIIAFGTILGLEQYEWKKMLVKFVLAAILVNFSRLICGVIIDIAQVVMITFVNGVAATAGGNLMTALNLKGIMELQPPVPGAPPGNIASSGSLFVASVGAVIFTGLTMAVLLAFLFILLARMIMLWVLIVLSPLAFVLSVIPQTQKYATQWWSEFGNHVIVGPVLLFFVWLSFVTVGSGDIYQKEIQNGADIGAGANSIEIIKGTAADNSAGPTKAMDWNSMANFAIAIGMLLVGAKVAQSLGVQGGAAMSKAVDFGKKVATIASGVAAGKWMYEKGAAGAKFAGKKIGLAAYHATGMAAGVERAKLWGEGKVEAYKGWRAGAATPQEKKIKKLTVANRAGIESEMTEEEYQNRIAAGEKLKVTKTRYDVVRKKEKVARMAEKKDEQGNVMKDERGNAIMEQQKDEKGNLMFDEVEGAIELETTEEMKKRAGFLGNWLGGRHQKLVKARKVTERSKKDTEVREDILRSQTGAKPHQWLWGQKEFVDGEDRIRQGRAAAEKMRSEAKTKDYTSLGRQETLENARFKDGRYETSKGTMAYRVAEHEAKAARTDEQIKQITVEAKRNFDHGKGKNLLRAKITAELNVKAAEGEHKAFTAAETNLVAKQTAAGIAAMARKGKAELGAKGEEEEMKAFEAKKRREQMRFGEGAKAVDKAAEFKAVQERGESRTKVLEGAAKLGFAASDEGKKLLREKQEAEMKGKTAEEAAKELESMERKEILSDTGSIIAKAFIEQMARSKHISEGLSAHEEKSVLKQQRADLTAALEELGTESTAEDLEAKSKTHPALYAARQLAERDHNYNFYRGDRQLSIDRAAQAAIWGPMNVHAPTNAAQEMVVDGIHKTKFASMNYDQALEAHGGHLKYIQGKKKEDVTMEDKMVALAIFKQLWEESWVDDGAVNVQEKQIKAREQAENLAGSITGADFKAQVESIKIKVNKSRSASPAFKPDQLSAVGAHFKEHGVSVEALNQIRKRENAAVENAFKESMRRIMPTATKFIQETGLKDEKELVKFLQSASDDQYKEVIKKLTS